MIAYNQTIPTTVSSSLRPTHVLPPNAGAGLPHCRCLVLRPVPHDCVHPDHSDHCVQPPCWVQFSTSRSGPMHDDPPLDGAGESHLRRRHEQKLSSSLTRVSGLL